MLTELDEEINTLEDLEVFILTCENIILLAHRHFMQADNKRTLEKCKQ